MYFQNKIIYKKLEPGIRHCSILTEKARNSENINNRDRDDSAISRTQTEYNMRFYACALLNFRLAYFSTCYMKSMQDI